MTQPERGALVGRILNGQYALIGVLGVGGMAEVYRGDDLALERDVAVKVLPPAFSGNPNLVARFRDEARRVANLSHPHIVPIYALGEDNGLLYIVMPMLRESLRHLLIREGTPPPADAVAIVQQVAGALEAAHAQGIIHRDVKPENILLDAAGSVYLSDFGIARTLARSQSGAPIPTIGTTGIPIGTPQYMAPEQIRCDPLDQRTDVYGLAAVLYELLAGVPPHGAVGAYEAAARALAGEIPPLAEAAPHVWTGLAAVVMTGLARDRDERYQSAGEFAQALRVALHTQSLSVVNSTSAGAAAVAPPASSAAAAIEALPTAVLTSGPGVARDAATVPMSGAFPPRPFMATHTSAPAVRRPTALATALILLLALLVVASVYLLTAGRPGSPSGPGASSGSRPGAVTSPSANSTHGLGTPTATRSADATPSTTVQSGTPASSPSAAPDQTAAPGQLAVSPTDANAQCSSGKWPTITLTNAGGQPVNWQGNTHSVTVSVSPSSGTLEPGGTQAVTVQSIITLSGTTVTITFTWSGSPQTVTIHCQ